MTGAARYSRTSQTWIVHDDDGNELGIVSGDLTVTSARDAIATATGVPFESVDFCGFCATAELTESLPTIEWSAP